MISWKRISKGVLIGCITLCILASVHWFSSLPENYYFLDKSKFNMVDCVKTESEHIISCGIEADYAERVYLGLREYFNAKYINNKIEIYVAKKSSIAGEIGFINGSPVIGVYKEGKFGNNDTIVYNGEETTLVHELGHYFFQNMKTSHTNEIFAKITQTQIYNDINYTLLNVKYTNLRASYSNLQNEFINEMNRWADRCSAKNKFKNKGVR